MSDTMPVHGLAEFEREPRPGKQTAQLVPDQSRSGLRVGNLDDVAGGPVSNDILKCELKPIDSFDYTVTFTAAEMARLQSIFPDNVCDWSKRGVNHIGGSSWNVVWASFALHERGTVASRRRGRSLGFQTVG